MDRFPLLPSLFTQKKNIFCQGHHLHRSLREPHPCHHTLTIDSPQKISQQKGDFLGHLGTGAAGSLCLTGEVVLQIGKNDCKFTEFDRNLQPLRQIIYVKHVSD